MASINFRLIGLTRLGFELAGVGIQTRAVRIPQSPSKEGGSSTHLATPSGTTDGIGLQLLT